MHDPPPRARRTAPPARPRRSAPRSRSVRERRRPPPRAPTTRIRGRSRTAARARTGARSRAGTSDRGSRPRLRRSWRAPATAPACRSSRRGTPPEDRPASLEEHERNQGEVWPRQRTQPEDHGERQRAPSCGVSAQRDEQPPRERQPKRAKPRLEPGSCEVLERVDPEHDECAGRQDHPGRAARAVEPARHRSRSRSRAPTARRPRSPTPARDPRRLPSTNSRAARSTSALVSGEVGEDRGRSGKRQGPDDGVTTRTWSAMPHGRVRCHNGPFRPPLRLVRR